MPLSWIVQERRGGIAASALECTRWKMPPMMMERGCMLAATPELLHPLHLLRASADQRWINAQRRLRNGIVLVDLLDLVEQTIDPIDQRRVLVDRNPVLRELAREPSPLREILLLRGRLQTATMLSPTG